MEVGSGRKFCRQELFLPGLSSAVLPFQAQLAEGAPERTDAQ